MIDPITSSLLTSLASNSGKIAEWVVTITDKGRRAQLEALKGIVDLAQAQLKAKAEEVVKLEKQVAELEKEKAELAEKVAYFEVHNDYEVRDGLLYLRQTGAGPCCPNDRMHMTVESKDDWQTIWKCPRCKHSATIKVERTGFRQGRMVR